MFKKIFRLTVMTLLLSFNLITAQNHPETETTIQAGGIAAKLQNTIIESADKTDSSARFSSLLFGPIADWQETQDKIAAEKFNLSVIQDKKFPEQKRLTEIQETLQTQKNSFDTLTAQINEFESKDTFDETETETLKKLILSLQDLEKEVEKNKTEEATLLEKNKLFEENRNTEKINTQTQILELENEAQVQIQLLKTQVFRVLKNIAVLVGVIIFLLLIRWFITRFVKKIFTDVKDDRIETILFITKVTVNILITFIIFGLLFAQFVNMLPFIALVSTGFAFALKDSISSFLAWFLIGTENGYRVGDVVKVNETYGRVKEITPFITVLRERFDEAESGKICTFPNKYIFEHEIKNYSRFYEFKQCRLTFHLTKESDYAVAKQVLKNIIVEINERNSQNLKRIDKRISRNFKLDPEDLKPYIWVQQGVYSINLEAKFFLRFKDHNLTKHAIEENFLQACQNETKIELAFD